MAGSLGFEIETHTDIRKDAFLFGESQSRVLVSVAPNQLQAFLSMTEGHSCEKLGQVHANNIELTEKLGRHAGLENDL